MPPPLPCIGEAIVPTSLDDWEFSDPVHQIDWLARLMARCTELASAQPLKRQALADAEGFDVRMWQTLMEIYLDVSGSMPNPIGRLPTHGRRSHTPPLSRLNGSGLN